MTFYLAIALAVYVIIARAALAPYDFAANIQISEGIDSLARQSYSKICRLLVIQLSDSELDLVFQDDFRCNRSKKLFFSEQTSP